jgi:hypothetical protein
MPFSLTLVGVITMVLTQTLGEAVTAGEVESFVKILGLIGGAVVTWYGRYRAGGISWWGGKDVQ